MPLLIPTHHLNTCPTLVKTSVGHSKVPKAMDMKFTTNCFFRQSFKPKHEASTWKQREIRSEGRSDKKWGFNNLIWSVLSGVSTFDNTGLVLADTAFGYS